MRWGRTLLMIVIGLVALLVVVLALAPSILNLEQIKEQAVNRVEQQLNRDVELGQVRLEFFNGLGAGLEQLTIANPKGWQSPYFVKVETLSVKVALRPLFSRKIEVSKIILNTGEIVVERDAHGRFNYDDLMAASADSTATTKPAQPTPTDAPEAPEASNGRSSLASLLVSKLALNDVDIKFIDQMVVADETVTTAVRQANLEADNIGFNTPIEFDLSSALLTDGESNLQVRGRIGPIPSDGRLDVQQIPLQLALKATGLQLAPVSPYLGEQPILIAGELGADIAIQGTLGNALHIKGQLSLDKAVMPDATGQRQPTALPAVTVTQDMTVNLTDALLTIADALLTIADVHANLGALQTTVSGTVKQFDSPSPLLDLSLNTSTFAIADVISQWPMIAEMVPNPSEAQGNIDLKATVKGTPERLHAITHLNAQPVSVRLSDGTQLALATVRFAQDAVLDLGQSLITLNQTDLDLGFLRTSLQGVIANFDSTPQVELHVNTSNFNPANVLSQLPMLANALPQPAVVQGDLKLQGKLQGPLDQLITDAQVTAQALSFKSGSFHDGSSSQGGMHIDISQMHTNLNAQLEATKPPTINVELKAERLVFDQRSASAPATAPDNAPPSPPSAPPTSKAPSINANGNITIASGSITGIAFRNLQAAFSVLNGLVKSRQTVQMFGGAYHGTLTANLAHAKPDYQLAIKLANLQAGEVANTFTSTLNLVFGQLNTELKFSGTGIDWSDISKTLTGNGKLNLTNFKLTTLDIMPKLAKSLSAAGAIAGFTVPDDLSTRSFDKLKANIRMQDGKIRSDDLNLWGPDVQLFGKGLFGLDRSLAFDGMAVLLGKLAKSLGKRAKFLLDQEGRINIPLAIQGTVTQPRIVLNENHLADLAQRALTQQLKDKAGGEVKKLLDQVLPGATSGDKPEESPDPLKDINKIIQGLIKK